MRVLYDAADPAWQGELAEDELVDYYDLDARPGQVTLRTNFVATLDGSVQGPDGRSGTINTPSDQWVFALQRALCDVVLVGAGTVRAEGYRAVDLDPWQQRLRSARGLTRLPTLVVVSESGELDPQIARRDGGLVLVATSTLAEPEALARLAAAGVEVLHLGRTPAGLDLPGLVGALAERGYTRILCEGGPALHRDLLAADLVTELALTLAPTVVGEGLRSTRGGALPEPGVFTLQFALLADDGALFTLYRRERG